MFSNLRGLLLSLHVLSTPLPLPFSLLLSVLFSSVFLPFKWIKFASRRCALCRRCWQIIKIILWLQLNYHCNFFFNCAQLRERPNWDRIIIAILKHSNTFTHFPFPVCFGKFDFAHSSSRKLAKKQLNLSIECVWHFRLNAAGLFAHKSTRKTLQRTRSWAHNKQQEGYPSKDLEWFPLPSRLTQFASAAAAAAGHAKWSQAQMGSMPVSPAHPPQGPC